jgi:hypothetical protein
MKSNRGNRFWTALRSIINANEPSGVTSYKSDGPVTLQVENGGQWSLRFVPLS